MYQSYEPISFHEFKQEYSAAIDSLHETLDPRSVRRAVAITSSLIIAMLKDLQKAKDNSQVIFHELGWRNKYNIHLLSGLSQKVIYREVGIIDTLVNLDVIKMKDAPTRWGRQKYHYRISNSFIQDWLMIEI